ncbi:hypothetical protein MCBRY_000347 [Methylocystis bryophila]
MQISIRVGCASLTLLPSVAGFLTTRIAADGDAAALGKI